MYNMCTLIDNYNRLGKVRNPEANFFFIWMGVEGEGIIPSEILNCRPTI